MTRENIEFFISTKIPAGEIATTLVHHKYGPDDNLGEILSEALNEARKNIASRHVNWDNFKSDSAYLDALETMQQSVAVIDLTISIEGTNPPLAWYFVRAHLSDEDRRIFVRNLQAPNPTIARMLMIWELAKQFHDVGLPSEEVDDFLSAVEIADVDWIPADKQITRAYLVESPNGPEVPVEFTSPKNASMADDVAQAFILASAADPAIDPSQYTSIRKPGAAVRYAIEADYNDGSDYRDWVDAVDTEEAEFHAAIAVDVNQSGRSSQAVIDDLGDFIEAVAAIQVTAAYPDPVTKDELVTAVRSMLSAYDSKSGLDEAISKLRDMVAVV